MAKTYIVQIQGWGDSEDEFYNMERTALGPKRKRH